MKIYISVVTNKKTGIREVGQISQIKKSAWIFYMDNQESNTSSYMEEWDLDTSNDNFEFIKRYSNDEDWSN